MQKRLTNKRLVKFLMDVKGLDSITVLANAVCVQAKPDFGPAQAMQLCAEVGHEDFKAATRGGHNYIIFKRW